MYFSSSFIRIASFGILFIFCGAVSVEACTIEKGPTPLFLEYIKNTEKRIQEIRAFAAANNKCNGTNGNFSNENKFLELLDRVSTQSPIGVDIMTDFRYSIILTTEGNSKNPVITHGKLLEKLETATIIGGLRSVSSACALDVVQPNGMSPQDEIALLLRQNRLLEAYYKNIALGDPRIPDDLSPSMAPLYEEIRANYSPEFTATCKGNGDLGSIEDVTKKILERLQQKAASTNRAQNSWEEAIALFAGRGSDTDKYKALQSRLLSAELARQGLTKKARDAMLKNLNCLQQKTTPSSTPEEIGKEKDVCKRTYIIGAENLTNWMKPLALKSTNTDQVIKRLLNYDVAKTRMGPDMMSFWQKIEETRNADEKLNDKMITDLVNMHAELTITNELLKKKSVEMYKNCMKAQPDVPCPQP